MVAAARRGQAQRAVARCFGIGLGHLQYWLARTRGQRMDRVDWSNQSNAPRAHGRQTKTSVQRRVLALRRELRQSDLGFVGAQAIQDALRTELPDRRLPSLRTIGRILKRHGALDAVRRVRRSAPPAGWYLPEVAAGTAELDAFDVIEDLPLEGGPRLDVLTTRALWGSVCGAWISAALRARWLCERLETHWRAHGCPAYAQFDNDSRFQGTHTHPDVLGQVIRFCLSLGVTPVFAPVREHGPQNLNESFNHLWQQKVWHRFHHASALAFQTRSDRFVAAYQRRRAAREDRAPDRQPFPKRWTLDLHQRPRGMVIYLRRTDNLGAIRVLGHRLEVDAQWVHRLVRAEVDLEAQQIRCYRLRRRAPDEQSLVRTIKYVFPEKQFHPT
jgi:putative transposase